MTILIYLGHPAQYHFVKNTVHNLLADGHHVKVLIKTKDILEDLLKEDGWDYENIQSTYRKSSKISILLASVSRTWQVLKIAKRFKADLLVGTDSSIAQAGWLLHKPAITILEDDYQVIKNLAKLTYPFTDSILVPDCCSVGKWDSKKVPYYGYMKLAYLHPSRFTPSETIVRNYGIDSPYVLFRLSRLSAHHDVGIGGLDKAIVLSAIEKCKHFGYKVYISSEGDMPGKLVDYRLKIKHTDMHHILAHASILVSDSQSMSVEAAMLGVPSIRFSDFSGRISVLEELESKYGLTVGVKTNNPERLISVLTEWLALPTMKESFTQKRQKMLDEKIDVTAFFTWFLENYPESRQIMKDNPDYQLRFK